MHKLDDNLDLVLIDGVSGIEGHRFSPVDEQGSELLVHVGRLNSSRVIRRRLNRKESVTDVMYFVMIEYTSDQLSLTNE